jgi:catechol 2,3-dioxygenase-like lactoylglutathione lyase family enzyme
MKIQKILETALYVNDIDQAEKFYTEVLNFEKIDKTPGRDLFLKCGETVLILFNPEQTKIDSGKVPTHGAVGPCHIAFGISDTEFPYWVDRLATHNIPIERTIDWNANMHSVYFRDPSGNSLEFASENGYK